MRVEPVASVRGEGALAPMRTHLVARDARDTGVFLRGLAQKSFSGQRFVTATITSPPYADVLDYGAPDQIGFGQTYERYLDDCRAVFEDVGLWTRDDGVLWMVADTAIEPSAKGLPGRLRPIPFDLAREAEKSGWVLRDVVIWRKDRTRPWSGRGRLRNAFEYVMMFVRSSNFKYNLDRLRDNQGFKSWWVRYPERHNPWGMAPDNVWDIPIPRQGSWASAEVRHACPLPAELVRRMLLLSTDPGDVVFDPFAGSGMVAAVSDVNGRIGIGTDINPAFVDAFSSKVLPHIRASVKGENLSSSPDMTRRLLTLRVLKYPRELLRQIARSEVASAGIVAAEVETGPFEMDHKTGAYAKAVVTLFVDSDFQCEPNSPLARFVDEKQRVAPLSKYTLDISVVIKRDTEIPSDNLSSFALYRKGRTWRSVDVYGGELLASRIWECQSDALAPIFSRLVANEELAER